MALSFKVTSSIREVPKITFTPDTGMKKLPAWTSRGGSLYILDSPVLRMNSRRYPNYQVLEVSSEGLTLYGEVSHPSWKAQYSRNPDPFWFCGEVVRMPVPGLVCDGVKYVVDVDLKWN